MIIGRMDYLGKVADFMLKHKQPVLKYPDIGNDELREFRLELIREEFEELEIAVESLNLVLIADALADLKYVIFGMDLALGIPVESVFAEVHRSNMSKDVKTSPANALLLATAAGTKVQKGNNYFKPNIEQIISQAMRMTNRNLGE
jgi:hypothetical protein